MKKTVLLISVVVLALVLGSTLASADSSKVKLFIDNQRDQYLIGQGIDYMVQAKSGETLTKAELYMKNEEEPEFWLWSTYTYEDGAGQGQDRNTACFPITFGQEENKLKVYALAWLNDSQDPIKTNVLTMNIESIGRVGEFTASLNKYKVKSGDKLKVTYKEAENAAYYELYLYCAEKDDEGDGYHEGEYVANLAVLQDGKGGTVSFSTDQFEPGEYFLSAEAWGPDGYTPSWYQFSKRLTILEKEPVPATIRLSKANLTIGNTNTKTVTATLSNLDDYIVSVKSSETNVAKAKISGTDILITPTKKAGNTTITVTTAMGAKAKVKVTVKASAALNEKKVTLKKGKTFRIQVLAIPATVKATAFKSSKPDVATVDAKGKVKAVKKGEATITVTLNNNKTLKLKVTVK